MTGAELVALLPTIVVGGTAVLALGWIAWRRSHAGVASLSATGLLATLILVPLARERGAEAVPPLLRTDGLFHLFTALLIAATLVCVVFAAGYFRREGRRTRTPPEELYVLLLLGALGGVVLAGSIHLASLFLGLELLSVSLYGLVAYTKEDASLEAGLKYLILAAASSAFLLLGGALVYGATGSLDLAAIGPGAAEEPVLILAGGALLFVALGFKLALVPFHLWTPDVYQGAPVPVTAFVASVSKGAVFALVIRWLGPLAGEAGGEPLFVGIAIAAAASMILGNLLALLQENLKRLLAYSSIAHLGYLVVAVVAAGDLAVPAGIYYAAAYLVTVLLAFGVIAAVSTADGEPQRIDDYRGLFWRRPLLAAALTGAMLSLAGIPLTAGFVGKFLVAAAAVEGARWALVLILVLTSAVGLFYYLRVVVAMFAGEGGRALGRVPALTGATLVFLVVVLVLLGVHPMVLFRVFNGVGLG